MYSGTTFHGKSGHVMGVHQRIDKIARRSLKSYVDDTDFPKIHDILHFEGKNGPDGIKRKSPGRDEPWHFIDPKNPSDSDLLDTIDDHIHNLSIALSENNSERTSFEAAWLAHAVTDGLTPAHHFPLEEKITELRGGEGLESRDTVKSKLMLPGDTRRERVRNNWEFWGAKGVMTSHLGFELGIMTSLASLKLESMRVNPSMLELVKKEGYRKAYLQSLNHIAELDMYHEYMRRGWKRRLARQTREVLIPVIVEMVILSWLTAIESREKKK